jgi:glutamine synthetase type III
MIAVILAAIDLEWTLRRTIDAVSGGEPAADSRKRVSGLDGYAKEWNKLCVKGRGIEPLENIVENWAHLLDYYQIRHDIVHGKVGSTGLKYASVRVEAMLQAAKAVAETGKTHKADPYKRLAKRRLVRPDLE